jgi:uncharacterized protein YacL
MSLWVIRIFFLLLCTVGGYAVSQYRPEILDGWWVGVLVGFGLGGLIVAVDEMLKGFSLRAFSAMSFGLILGEFVAWFIDRSGLFIWTDPQTQWIIRLGLFLSFGYIGMVLAMRSNKDDFSLIIPYVRFKATRQPENFIVLDTNVIIDGRIADLIEGRFIEGIVVVPKFVLNELQLIADSPDAARRARGRRGLEMLNRLQQNPRCEVRIHQLDFPGDDPVDARLVRVARALDAKLYTNDYNLAKVAELQSVQSVNLNEMAVALKPVVLPGDVLRLRLAREGKEKGQAVGYLPDGTMVVVNRGQPWIGQQADVQVQSLVQTGAGVIIFAETKMAAAA